MNGNKFMSDEIVIEKTNNISNKKSKQKKVMERKKKTSHLNLTLSIMIFIFMLVIALYIIINKGKIGSYSLIPINNSIHTAELECDSYFLSITDSEVTDISLTIDGIKRTEGYVLSSSDSNIAKIEENKVVVGEKKGTATITAYYEEYDMRISTDVLAYVPLNAIIVNANTNTIIVGKEISLNTKFTPKNATGDYITYSSSDESIAKVNKDGVIKGISKGNVTITIKDELTGAVTTKDFTIK